MIALLIGSLGATVVAGHQIALELQFLGVHDPLLPEHGRGPCGSARPWAGEPREARSLLAWGWAPHWPKFATAAWMLLFREQIATIYTVDPQVVQVAAMLIVFAALFQFSDDPGDGRRRCRVATRTPGDHGPDPVRLLGLGPAGGLLAEADRSAGQPSGSSGLGRPDHSRPQLRGGDAGGAPGTQCAQAHPHGVV